MEKSSTLSPFLQICGIIIKTIIIKEIEKSVVCVELTINETGVTQVVTNVLTGQSVNIPPNFLYPSFLCPARIGPTYKSVLAAINHRCHLNDKPIIIRRGSALGDVVMSLSALSTFNSRIHPTNPTLVSAATDYHTICSRLNDGRKAFLLSHLGSKSEYALGVTFDGVFEHDLVHFQGANRIDIATEILLGTDAVKHTFYLKKLKSICTLVENIFQEKKVPQKKYTIGVVLDGISNRIGSGLANAIVDKLSGIKDSVVISLGNDFGYRRAISVGDKFKPEHLFELVDRCSVLVTVDSAMYWISHYTETPTVLLLNGNLELSPGSKTKYHKDTVPIIADFTDSNARTLAKAVTAEVRKVLKRG